MNWISIKDKHPNHWTNRRVLVYIPMSYNDRDVLTVYNDCKGGSKFSNGFNKGDHYEVTHWMPIPEPPKE